jgi:WhiB family redox-sensing transcriptional regulator
MAEPVPFGWGKNDSEWRTRAACRGHGDIFWPDWAGGRNAYADALAICARCPVRDPCARYAATVPDLTGVWGGRLIGANQARPAKAVARA